MLGSKAASGAYQAIIALMPPHDTFIDLYAGSGAIVSRKPPCLQSYAVDLDPSMLERIPDAPRLTKVRGSARSFLDGFNYAAAGRLLIYADPPYLHSTRTSRSRYRFEMTDSDHLDLLRDLRAVPASVMLSGYPSALYDANLPGWHSIEFQVMTRGGVRTEKVWFNFEPTKVSSSLYAGRDFTDRQRIKRKAQRWAANYVTMPPGERLAVLNAILSAEIDTGDSVAGHIARPISVRRSAQMPLPMVDQPQTFTKSSLFIAKPTSGIDGPNLQGRCNTLQVTSILRKRGSVVDR